MDVAKEWQKRALVQKLHNQPLYVIVALNMVTASKCHAFVTSQIHHNSHHTPSTQMQKCHRAKVAKCQSAKTPGARCHAYLTSHSILAPVSIIRRPCITCTLCTSKELAARVAGDLQRMCSLEYRRVRKGENFPDSKIFVAKTFRIKPVNCIIFQIRDKYA